MPDDPTVADVVARQAGREAGVRDYVAAGGRNPLAPRGRRRVDIRHLTLDQYRYLRDVGLGGQQPDSQVDWTFRGWASHRNRAGSDLVLGSGHAGRSGRTALLLELGIGVKPLIQEAEFTCEACAICLGFGQES
ncbi:hypothetical protein [Streptomyces sp. SAJ15]|uniref:hypothetical protein n=1 Tax=Streptomyces sp. SAJ15 TaxID=2011095 RepID=UPI001186D844|nr:hypothetical protein [Streptomyces sp. SAJ15]TVL88459.1 hypothetical protein CD790_30910 [Streptomyces sp. SAJ15]